MFKNLNKYINLSDTLASLAKAANLLLALQNKLALLLLKERLPLPGK